ncbi:DUF86 domain-containing protein [Nocardioides sp. InS609-2]|uniref:HepT-like ribonuclease domain-containing protein n=1 Tax=Nocardioides sp. InS609-2 TaxID=2760705 RepID=UPI0020BD5A90|nr:DUF86 domain-containing protein [Nocardioides sp. InS609-2]
MQPESPALIWDARRAAGRVLEFVADRNWDDYQQDVMLRSAVERQFQIIGEALNRLRKVDPDTAGRVPELARIVAFRNVLVHGYAQIDDALVWEVASTRVPALSDVLAGLLDDP